jgi:hypothetical protein
MNPATIQLAHLISTDQPGNVSWQPPGTYGFRPKIMHLLESQILTLLDEGADVNIAVCIYKDYRHNRILYRLIGSDPMMDSLCQQHSGLLTPADDMWSHKKTMYIDLIVSPLIDAAAQSYIRGTYLFSSRGARFDTVLERLSTCQVPTGRLSNPFLGAFGPYGDGALKRILDIADPEHPIVRDWVSEAIEKTMHEADDHSPVTLLRRTDLGSNRSRAIIDPTYRNRIMSATQSTSKPDIPRVVSLVDVLQGALVPRDQSCQTARGPHGITPLMVAIGNATTALCKHLLDRGANPNEYDDFGMTALMEAIYYGHEEAVELLLAYGAETNNAKPGSMPTSYTAPKDSIDWQDEFLFQRNAYAKMCMDKGWSTLHLAAQKGRLKALQLLCNASAHLAALDENGNSALDIAMLESQDIAAYHLLSRQCPFNSGSPAASRLLTQAFADCKYDLVSQLIKSDVLPLSDSGFEEEYAEEKGLPKIEERAVNLLPQKVTGAGPFMYHEEFTSGLCVNCSTGLEIAKFGRAGYTNSNCKLCQLLTDCSNSPYDLPAITFSRNDDARDDELTTVSSGSILRHPLKKVPGRFISLLISRTLPTPDP